ncbi:MAG: PIG-L family deacetylase [Acidimicrobiia bacterium]|nr:PIG-L family deacetylase [Acidimicrobiia bacterium]MDH5236149.1 PIG-L family deacetylase [Acidimicrobiia bacterium]
MPDRPISTSFTTPASALAIAAHPDDIEFGCGATLARWATRGCVVHLLVCTDGSKGTWDVDADTAALIARRQDEQRAAAAAMGATGEVRFLGEIDGELAATLENRGRVARIIRELQPQVVLGHDPWTRWRLHPDHREAGLLTVEGIVAARDPHFFPEHDLAHHRPRALLLFESEEPDLVLDVDGHGPAKAAALEAHVSQFETTMEIDDEADQAQRQAFRARIADELAEIGAPHGFGAAEAFRQLLDL